MENKEEKIKRVGTKHEVYNGQASRTSGGLTKDKLKVNRRGKIVSSAKSDIGNKLYENFGKKKLPKDEDDEEF